MRLRHGSRPQAHVSTEVIGTRRSEVVVRSFEGLLAKKEPEKSIAAEVGACLLSRLRPGGQRRCVLDQVGLASMPPCTPQVERLHKVECVLTTAALNCSTEPFDLLHGAMQVVTSEWAELRHKVTVSPGARCTSLWGTLLPAGGPSLNVGPIVVFCSSTRSKRPCARQQMAQATLRLQLRQQTLAPKSTRPGPDRVVRGRGS